jgi:HEAT repeat protein
MTAVLGDIVLALLALLTAGVLADLVMRFEAVRRARRERRVRPAAEAGIAGYLAGTGTVRRPGTAGERSVWLTVAIEAMLDLRGDERARLAALLDQLGYVARQSIRLHARRAGVRRHAAEVLTIIATPAALSALAGGIDDSDPQVRCTCARALAKGGGPDGAAAAIAVAQRDALTAPGPVATAVLVLGQYQPAELAPLLGPAAGPAARMVGVRVAGALRLSQHNALLRVCLGGEDELAAAAAAGLGAIGDVESVPALIALAVDEARTVRARAAAASALGAIGDSSAVGVLGALLGSTDWWLRAAAAAALGQLGAPGAAMLRQVVAAGPARTRAQAEAVLAP